MASRQLDDLDPAGTLARAEELLRQRRAVELEDLHAVAHWADLHACDPRRGPGGRRRWCGEDRLVQVGGEGTPLVQELCLPELAIARRVHPLTMRSVMADVLDLRHRLPRTWAVVEALEAEAWLARRVAVLTRHLEPAPAAIVDAAVAEAIAGQAPSRVLELAAAKVIEVDPAGHAAKLAAEARRRFVSLSQTDEHGLRLVIARITAGDAVWIDAMVARVAEILTTRPDLRPETPTEISRDEARALAFGWLARPAELLTLLLETADTTPADTTPAEEPAEKPDEEPAPEPEEPVEPSRAVTLTDRALDLLRRVDLKRLRPKTVLYVHLHQGAVEATTGGVARVEGHGPLLLTQVTTLLAHTHVTLKPVIDLHHRVSVNSYEFPETIKERLHLRVPAEAFPHATRMSRKVDIDHPVPFDPHGPPGQTGTHNAAPLGRTGHRAKTHLGYHLTQTEHGDYLWSTPHGLHRLIDDTGTHPIDDLTATTLTLGQDLDRALDRLTQQLRTGALG